MLVDFGGCLQSIDNLRILNCQCLSAQNSFGALPPSDTLLAEPCDEAVLEV